MNSKDKNMRGKEMKTERENKIEHDEITTLGLPPLPRQATMLSTIKPRSVIKP
jgi:hypothetical protein